MSKFCKICKDAGKTEKEYTSHFVKDKKGPEGKVTCPVLLSLNCRYCKKQGHTTSHCPLLQKNNEEKKNILPQRQKENTPISPISPWKLQMPPPAPPALFPKTELRNAPIKQQQQQKPEASQPEASQPEASQPEANQPPAYHENISDDEDDDDEPLKQPETYITNLGKKWSDEEYYY